MCHRPRPDSDPHQRRRRAVLVRDAACCVPMTRLAGWRAVGWLIGAADRFHFNSHRRKRNRSPSSAVAAKAQNRAMMTAARGSVHCQRISDPITADMIKPCSRYHISSALRLQSQLDQVAERIGATGIIRSSPGLHLIQHGGWQPYRHGGIATGGRPADLFLLVYLN